MRIEKAKIAMERMTSNHSNPLTDSLKEFPRPNCKQFRLLYKRLDLAASLIHILGINLVAQQRPEDTFIHRQIACLNAGSLSASAFSGTAIKNGRPSAVST